MQSNFIHSISSFIAIGAKTNAVEHYALNLISICWECIVILSFIHIRLLTEFIELWLCTYNGQLL